MKAAGIIVLFLVSSSTPELTDECEMAGFYVELGCTPLAADGTPRNDTTSCPTAYSCPEKDPTKCRFNGVLYDDGSTIPETDLADRPCSQHCRCSARGAPSIACAVVDCPEIFDGNFNADECVRTYKREFCCSTGSVCGKDEIAKLQTCDVNGKNYKEGQSYEVPGTRKTCYCTKDWNGTIDNPMYCSEIKCDLELYYQENLYSRKCAPVFLDSRPEGCPIYMQCQSDTELKMAKALNPSNVKTQCTFGNMTLSVGDEVFFPKDCTVKCACAVPPYLSCTKVSKSCD